MQIPIETSEAFYSLKKSKCFSGYVAIPFLARTVRAMQWFEAISASAWLQSPHDPSGWVGPVFYNPDSGSTQQTLELGHLK
jgi:hypothetical protein